jgi:DNA polymerase III epsilon subunit-like protein
LNNTRTGEPKENAMEKYEEHNMVFIDFETTGSNPYIDFPIQIGAVSVDEELSIKNKFSSLIKPPPNAFNTSKAFSIHQIDLRNLNDAPDQRDVLTQFSNCFGTSYRFAAWNVSFDVSFFRKMCNDNKFNDFFNRINYRHIDIQTICSFANKIELIDSNVHSLDDCVKYFKLKRSYGHDALEDSILALEVYKNLLITTKSACQSEMTETI